MTFDASGPTLDGPLGLAMTTTEMMMVAPKIVVALFVLAFGACVGSFLNVVAYRLPAGRSVVSPPSRCPACAGRLGWKENLPILGWVLLRGRCSRCRSRISPSYPAVELFVGILFAAVYLSLYLGDSGAWYEAIGGAWWRRLGLAGTWPAFIVVLTLFGSLVAATLVDAKTYLIPAAITNVLVVVATVGWGIQACFSNERWGAAVGGFPIAPATPAVALVVLGSMLGLLFSMVLIWTGKLGRSFMDYEDYVQEGDVLAEYPHARREMARELLFLGAPCLGGLVAAAAGVAFGASWSGSSPPTLWSVLAGVGLGWIVGGGLVWGVRILGTLAFGREAMGMGDVHLLAAIGAALGWADPIRIFFLAPFLALAWIAGGRVASLFRRSSGRELPYGPHLAAATVAVWFGRPVVDWFEASVLLPPP